MGAIIGGVILLGASALVATGTTDRPEVGEDYTEATPEEVATTTDVDPTTTSASPVESTSTLAPVDLVEVDSGLLGNLDVEPPSPAPVRLTVASLGVVGAEVRAVGYDPWNDVMEVPTDAHTIGWYRYGAVPGGEGSAVLAAHVTWHGQRGAFFSLGELEPGSLIEVEFADGSVAQFESVARATFAKAELPTSELFARDVPPVLHLITCGGEFDSRARSYHNNIVVTAVAV